MTEYQGPWQQSPPPPPTPHFVPIYAQERAVPVGIAGVVLGSLSFGFIALTFAASSWGWFVLALLLSIIGTPIAAVALGRRARRRMPFTIALIGLIFSSVPLALIALALLVNVIT
jgi:hypothetical protein